MRFIAFMLLVPLFAGCFAGDGQETQNQETPADEFVPRVVLAIIDTGLQPYHEEFRQNVEPNPMAHPSSYVPGYPADATTLNLTLDLNSTVSADYFQADQDTWASVQEGTLYHIPGTKVIGMIGFGAAPPGGGHGTMTSSRSTGNNVSIVGEEVLLVNIRTPLNIPLNAGGSTPESEAVRWSADQDWIDIQSNSWGMPFMCVGPAANELTGWMDAFKYARDKQLVFSAVHNGHANSGTLGYPSQCQDTAGPAGVIPVGANDNDGFPTWANWFPAVSGDGCANPAVNEATTDQLSNNGGGTSSATPFTAGGAAKLILEARRTFRDPGVGIHEGVIATNHNQTLPETGPLADGVFTMDELKAILFATAISPPQVDPSDGGTCLQRVPFPANAPPEATYPFIGYGEVNRDSIHHALEVMNGTKSLPVRLVEDNFYMADQEARAAAWG